MVAGSGGRRPRRCSRPATRISLLRASASCPREPAAELCRDASGGAVAWGQPISHTSWLLRSTRTAARASSTRLRGSASDGSLGSIWGSGASSGADSGGSMKRNALVRSIPTKSPNWRHCGWAIPTPSWTAIGASVRSWSWTKVGAGSRRGSSRATWFDFLPQAAVGWPRGRRRRHRLAARSYRGGLGPRALRHLPEKDRARR
jgi:hypothetical protein